MTENFESDPLSASNEEFQDLRLRLSRLPHHPAPSGLIHNLKKEYMGHPWLDTFLGWFAWPVVWKPAGALALAALLAGVWMSKWNSSKNDFIDAQPLLAAHSRYQAEMMVPPGDIAGAAFEAKLASYYGDK